MNGIKIVLATGLSMCLLTAIYADNPSDHQVAQARPIQLGTSGGNIRDQSYAYCCSGTLGALVEDRKGRLYILSNNHVLARTNRGQKGNPITQPGLVDANCSLSDSDAVATLTRRKALHFDRDQWNVVDCALAQILPGQVDTNGNILGIGILNAQPVAATVGLAVKKSGRTSGVTQGVVAAVDVSILVDYDRVCGLGTRVALFVHQIRITPGGFGDFSEGGDSGSLVVEDVDSCPRPVGLLFAGGNSDTFANPIIKVLGRLKVSLVGCTSTSSVAALPLAQSAVAGRVSAQSFAACQSVKQAVEADLLRTPGVVGVGIGVSDSDPTQAALEVYSSAAATNLSAALSKAVRSVPVKVIQTGTIHAL
ncbi:MAG TPA: hypothetical protein VL486_14825 [Verrucomicrobiae bacterium]|nr:hypothetical protein [Verrucomicrobiae bacterium]